MLTSVLESTARVQFLDDTGLSYKWSRTYLTQLLSLAEREACKRADLLFDSTTASICQISIQAGISVYTLSPKIIKIDKCYLTSKGKGQPLVPELKIISSLTGTPLYYTEGRGVITLYPTPTETDTLNLEVYRYPLVDLTVATSPITGTATATTASKLVDITAVFTTAVIGKTVFNTTDNTWAIVTARDSATTLSLSANIMASGEVYTIGTTSNDSTPEIAEDYHFDLIHYACCLAFIKQDNETIDPVKSAWHEAQFALKFGNSRSAHEDTMLKMFPAGFEIKRNNYGL